MKKYLYLSVVFAFCLSASHASAAETIESDIIKGSGPEVYFYNGETRSHFPNWDVYRSWLGKMDFSIQNVSDEVLSAIPVGQRVTIQPGELLKFDGSPKVYLIEKPNILHWVTNERDAEEVYIDPRMHQDGAYKLSWKDYVVNQPAERMADYVLGSDFNPIDGPQWHYQRISQTTSPSQVLPLASVDRFIHPGYTKALDSWIRGYEIEVPMRVDAVTAWMKDNFTGDLIRQSDVLEEGDGGLVQRRYLVYEWKEGSRDAHRTVEISSPIGGAPSTVKLTEIVYPENYFAYPGAATLSYESDGKIVRQSMVSFDASDEIFAWYESERTAHGYAYAYSAGQTYPILYLHRNKDDRLPSTIGVAPRKPGQNIFAFVRLY